MESWDKYCEHLGKVTEEEGRACAKALRLLELAWLIKGAAKDQM